MRRIVLLTMTVLLGSAAATSAQEQARGDRAGEIDLVALGDRVRFGDEIRFTVAYSAEPLTGWLAAISEDSVIIRIERRKYVAVPVTSIFDLEVKRRGRATLGMVVGGLVGVAAGVGIAANNVSNCRDEWFADLCEANNATLYLAPVALAVAGGFLGRAIGGLIAPERWESVPLRRLALSPVANGEPGISIKITLASGR